MHALYHYALLQEQHKNEWMYEQMNKIVSLEADLHSKIREKGKAKQI